MFFELAALAYLVDMVFGEFPCKHPVVLMGDFINGFERRFYSDRILPGALLVVGLIALTLLVSATLVYLCGFLPAWLSLIILADIRLHRAGHEHAARKRRRPVDRRAAQAGIKLSGQPRHPGHDRNRNLQSRTGNLGGKSQRRRDRAAVLSAAVRLAGHCRVQSHQYHGFDDCL